MEEYTAAEKYANDHPLDPDSLADNFRVQSWLDRWLMKYANKEDEMRDGRTDAGLAEAMIETLQQYY